MNSFILCPIHLSINWININWSWSFSTSSAILISIRGRTGWIWRIWSTPLGIGLDQFLQLFFSSFGFLMVRIRIFRRWWFWRTTGGTTCIRFFLNILSFDQFWGFFLWGRIFLFLDFSRRFISFLFICNWWRMLCPSRGWSFWILIPTNSKRNCLDLKNF